MLKLLALRKKLAPSTKVAEAQPYQVPDVVGGRAGGRSRAEDSSGFRPLEVAPPPPHDDELWISAEDAWHYAQWLNERIKDLDGRVSSANPKTQGQAVGLLQFQMQWNKWRDLQWGPYFAAMKESTWARVNSWDKTKGYQLQLEEYRAKFKALGFDAGAPTRPPRDPEDKVWQEGGGAVGAALSRLGTAGAVALVVVAGVLVWRVSK